MTTAMDGWARREFTADGRTRDVFRRGSGPGVIVIHEMPGITPQVAAFAWALQQTSPIITWLRALAADLHASVGGPGVGAVGMCFSIGIALGMMVDAVMVAPVLSQPSLPFAMGKPARPADLNLTRSSPSNCPVRRSATIPCSPSNATRPRYSE